MSESAPHHRFPWRVTAIVVLVVAVASVAAGLLLVRDQVGSPSAVPSVAPTVAPTVSAAPALPFDDDRQLTVLLTVRDDERQAVGSVLLATRGGTDSVAELMLPRDLLLPTSPPLRLKDATDPTGSQTAADPLQTLLGVRVDAILDLDRLAWSGLIDATGVDDSTVQPNQGMAFAALLDRVLARIPEDASQVGELLTGLGSMARTNITNEDMSSLLALIGQGVRAAEPTRQVLPAVSMRSGDERASVVLLERSAQAVADLFPEAGLETGHRGPLRVVLQRAGASLGVALDTATALTNEGIGVVQDPTERKPTATTSILVPDGTPQARAAGTQIAELLGLPAGAVRVDAEPGAAVDARVVLGRDATFAE